MSAVRYQRVFVTAAASDIGVARTRQARCRWVWASLLVLVLWFTATPVLAQPQWYQIDPVHTRVLFFVEHARFSRSIGMFRPVDGGLWFDREDWGNSRVELCMPLSALDMGDRRWQQALLRPDWFDAGRHPDLCFRSSKVELDEPPRGRLHGTLSVRGVDRPWVLDFTVNDERRFSLTLKRRLGISATGVLSRADFGMSRDTTLVGDRVEVVIELEAQVADPPQEPSAKDRPARR